MDTTLQYRQGDVLIVLCDGLPVGARSVAREEGRIVLAHGEVTGHAHAITESDVEMYEKDGNYYIRVPREATVQHEEHRPIPLGSGTYRIVRQREYVPGMLSHPFDRMNPSTDNWDQPGRRGWFRFVLD